MLQAEFFFDFSCPWTYLACARLREAAMRTGAEIIWKPFALVDLDPAMGAREARLDSAPERASWQLQDLRDWARYCDLPLELPADWPCEARAALRGAVFAAEEKRAAAYVTGVFAALYGQGRNITAADELADIATAAGLDAAAFGQALGTDETAAALARNAAELRSRGGFRSATLFVGDAMYCGNSRMPLVEFELAQASGRSFVMPGQHN
ncbi:MAG: DsbA family protein [Chromatiales bacterium]|nr:MAG: DsbA family protein [Chromatiales bacterium]